MKPTIEIFTKLQENSAKNHDEIFTKLFRYILRPDIYYVAYRNLYANNGAATKGVNEDTADGFGEDYVTGIIAALKNGTYKPNPVRRTYIQKANGKLRPLGLPTFSDKLIQDVIRMILQAIYEPIFSDYSHGFRPGRSCHTALSQIKHEFVGAKWFVEGDIKGCFDTIWKAFQKALEDAGLEHHRLHDCRHTFAVNSIRAGDDIKTIQENMGHYSAAFTLDRYGHVTETMRQESANRMQAFIQGMSGNEGGK